MSQKARMERLLKVIGDDGKHWAVNLGAANINLDPMARTQLSQDGKVDPVAGLMRATINAVILGTFPQGMSRQDGRVWGGIQNVLFNEENPRTLTVSTQQLAWLKHIIGSETLKVPPQLAGPREALLELLAKATEVIPG
jgi:hypothetical protein